MRIKIQFGHDSCSQHSSLARKSIISVDFFSILPTKNDNLCTSQLIMLTFEDVSLFLYIPPTQTITNYFPIL